MFSRKKNPPFSHRLSMDETSDVTSAALTVIAGLVPAIHVVQPHCGFSYGWRRIG